MVEKSETFYVEIVLVTVLSIVAANAWADWFTAALKSYSGGNLSTYFIAAVVITALAMLVLTWSFRHSKDKIDYPTY